MRSGRGGGCRHRGLRSTPRGTQGPAGSRVKLSKKALRLWNFSGLYTDDDNSDVTYAALRMGFSLLPGGSFINELLTLVQARSVARRQDVWREELEQGLDELRIWRSDLTAQRLAEQES